MVEKVKGSLALGLSIPAPTTEGAKGGVVPGTMILDKMSIYVLDAKLNQWPVERPRRWEEARSVGDLPGC